MPQELVIAMAQINPTVGDLERNASIITDVHEKARAQGAEIVVFPELCVVGYPPEDLVLKRALQEHSRRTIARLAQATADGAPAMVIGAPWVEDGSLYNAVFLLADGEIKGWRAKHLLPTYGVFDEDRVFAAGPVPGPVTYRTRAGDEVRLGLMVCEDMWTEDVAEGLEESGAEILIVINGSPYEHDKQDVRVQLAVARVTETGLALVYVNQMSGQDELVFDGASFALDVDRSLVAQAPSFEEALVMTRWQRLSGDTIAAARKGEIARPLDELAGVYGAMQLGLRDYVRKNGFPGVVIGLSGGIDSALTAAVAVDALGPDQVHCVMMPSRYTSAHSLEDAAEAARLLGTRLDEVAIEPAVEAFTAMLAPLFADRPPDITEENLQSRIRGMTLMAISNKFGSMVVTTGNKSEMSVGYATLYGDMCGGYSVLKDVYKTMVFELCHWRNANLPAGALGPKGTVVPPRIIEKPPSAELRADQKDEDSLPPYPVLDRILAGLVEGDMSPRELVEAGEPVDDVKKVQNLLDIAEYKRRQAPPGVKITRKAFGRDRRYPITNAFRRIGVAEVDSPQGGRSEEPDVPVRSPVQAIEPQE